MQGPTPEPSVVTFEDVLVIVGGGTLDDQLLRTLHANGARLVGADGGADRIAVAGLVPELIVGDLDSLDDPESWRGRARLLKITEQETTDFEKALYSTRAPVTVAMGMTGNRLDHTLAALDAMSRHAASRKVVLVDAHDLALALTGPFAFAVEAGERVSVHPLAPVTFKHSEGLQYPLDGLQLAPGLRTGTSNAALEGAFSITPEVGIDAPWLLILDNRHLLPLIDALKSG